jgi:hypothetical protein
MGGLSLRCAQARNSQQSKFEPRQPSGLKPTRAGCVDLADEDTVRWAGIVDPEWLHVLPWGIGPAGSSMQLRLWGWSAVEDREKLYIPTLLVDASANLDVDGSSIGKGVRMAEHIASNETSGPIPTVATFNRSLVVHARGSRWIEFEFARPEGSEVEGMNAFWKVGR